MKVGASRDALEMEVAEPTKTHTHRISARRSFNGHRMERCIRISYDGLVLGSRNCRNYALSLRTRGCERGKERQGAGASVSCQWTTGFRRCAYSSILLDKSGHTGRRPPPQMRPT